MTYFQNLNVTNGFQDLLTYSNSVTNNFFGATIIFGVFMVLFIGLKTRGFPTEKAFASASFSSTLVSYIMVLIPNVISPSIVTVLTLLTAISIIMLYRTGAPNESY